MNHEGPLLIIKTGSAIRQAAELGDFDDWIRDGAGLTNEQIDVCRVDEGDELPEINGYRAAVITGSPAMVTERLPWSEATADWLRRVVPSGLPVLGICYGHQLLAHAFGGKVAADPTGREIGTVDVLLKDAATDDSLFGGFPRTFVAQATHVESVVELPADAVELARSEHPANHAFRIGKVAWGVQFHPEFDDVVMSSYLKARAEVIRAEGIDPEALIADTRPAPWARSVLRRFAEIAGLR